VANERGPFYQTDSNSRTELRWFGLSTVSVNERSVRVNVPLLPILIDFHWRPLRPFQVSLRLVMFIEVVASVYCWLVVKCRRLSMAGSHHAVEAITAPSRFKSPYEPGGFVWHGAMSHQYHAAASRIELWMAVILWSAIALLIVAILGRVLQRVFRRSIVASRGPDADAG
jgi:hypothetical protein